MGDPGRLTGGRPMGRGTFTGRQLNADPSVSRREAPVSSSIEERIAEEDWPGARKLIRAELKRTPNSHWLLTRLGLTYYEQRQYARALQIEERALRISPGCPLVLWDYAGSLQMLKRHAEAVVIYSRLIRQGARSIAYGECGEGLAWARGLVVDCHYRRGESYRALGRKRAALADLVKHLDGRGPGCRSIYPLREVRAALSQERRVPKHAGY
jgi:tetratricopeptide (TPR) repeat protein